MISLFPVCREMGVRATHLIEEKKADKEENKEN